MSDHLFALRLFLRVARKGSFSSAGRDLNIPQSTVSRTVAALERRIGTSLLVRTTRAVTLTDAGTDFLDRLEPILVALEEAEQCARGTGQMRGMLRVGLGSSLAVRAVIPRLPPFMHRHPDLQIDLMMTDQRQDLITEGVDVALRFGVLADSSATARRIRAWPRVLVASQAYLDKQGVPKIPADLPKHSVIAGPAGINAGWAFRKDGTSASVRVEGRLTVRANEGAIAAAVAGLGLVMTTLGSCRRELERGELIRVLSDWDAGSLELHAVFANRKTVKPAARAFTDYLTEALRDV